MNGSMLHNTMRGQHASEGKKGGVFLAAAEASDSPSQEFTPPPLNYRTASWIFQPYAFPLCHWSWELRETSWCAYSWRRRRRRVCDGPGTEACQSWWQQEEMALVPQQLLFLDPPQREVPRGGPCATKGIKEMRALDGKQANNHWDPTRPLLFKTLMHTLSHTHTLKTAPRTC